MEHKNPTWADMDSILVGMWHPERPGFHSRFMSSTKAQELVDEMPGFIIFQIFKFGIDPEMQG